MMMMSEPEPTEVRPTTRPPRMPISSVGSRLTTNGQRYRPVLASLGQQRPNDEAGGDHQQRDAERQLECACIAAPEPSLRSSSTPRNAEGIEPSISQVPALVDGAPPPVHRAADRLHHHRRDDVAGDGGQRLDAEQQHQDRRHQRAATHPGQADDESHERSHRRSPMGRTRSASQHTPGSCVHENGHMCNSASRACTGAVAETRAMAQKFIPAGGPRPSPEAPAKRRRPAWSVPQPLAS